MSNPVSKAWIFIVLEIAAGVAGGIIYINSGDDEPPTRNLGDSIFHFYLVLNGIYFAATILIGCLSAVYLKKVGNIPKAVMASVITGLGFLVVHALVLPIPWFVFFSLLGYILGFNYRIFKKPVADEYH